MRFARFTLAAVATASIAGIAACSDPVPPTPQGAWAVSFVNNDPSKCMIAGHNSALGDVTSNSRNKVLVQGGLEGATIECQVTGTTSFEVHALASNGADGLKLTIKGITPAASPMAMVDGQVSFVSEKTGGNAFVSPTSAPCKFYFTPNTLETVASGRIWVSFICEEVGHDMSTCSIKQGYAIFENCTE